jgi:adenylate kinase family enzyme
MVKPRVIVLAHTATSYTLGRRAEAELVRRLASRLICEDCGANAAFAEAIASGADRPMMNGAGGSEPEAIAALRATIEPQRCRRCGGRLVQRSDDTIEVVRERLKVYRLQSKPLVDYYKVRPAFRSINGAQSPDRVARDLASAIDEAGNGLLRSGARS